PRVERELDRRHATHAEPALEPVAIREELFRGHYGISGVAVGTTGGSVGAGVSVGSGVGSSVGASVAVAVGVAVGVAVSVGVCVGVSVGVSVSVGVGVGVRFARQSFVTRPSIRSAHACRFSLSALSVAA